MTMEDMRRGIKRHRKVVLVVIIVLIVGLVASFAFMGSGGKDFSSLKTGSDSEQAQSQIDALESYLSTYKPADGTDKYGFSDYSTLASTYASLTEAYMTQGDSTKWVESANKALKDYQLAYENAPAELNDLGKAQLIAGEALMYFYTGDNASALSTYKKALALAPDDLDTNYKYAYIIYVTKGLDAAVQVMTDYKNSLPEGNENRDYADQIIANFKQEAASAQTSQSTTDSSSAQSSTTSTDSTGSSANSSSTTTSK